MTTTQEQTIMTTSSLFQKRPLVKTVKRKLMLHQETKLKHPQLKCLSHKIAVSVKCQNLLVIQVSKNMICFSCYCPIVHLGGVWGVIVRTVNGGFVYRTCCRLRCSSVILHSLYLCTQILIPDVTLGSRKTANLGTGLYSLKRRRLK